jgi:AcrR family transcriptional regulator
MTTAETGLPVRVRPQRADARRNYDRIVEVARVVFTERGGDAPLDEIAKRAGVGPGTLYRHFPHRQALLEAVYLTGLERLCERAYKLRDEQEPFQALVAWCRAFLDYAAEKRGLMVALLAIMDRGSEFIQGCRAAVQEASGALLVPAQEAGLLRADLLPADIPRLIHAVAVASETAPEASERLFDVVIEGLRTR